MKLIGLYTSMVNGAAMYWENTGIADEDTYSGGKVTLIRSASWISEWEHTHRYTLRDDRKLNCAEFYPTEEIAYENNPTSLLQRAEAEVAGGCIRVPRRLLNDNKRNDISKRVGRRAWATKPGTLSDGEEEKK
ncbi:hypothetical protein PV327_002636 [Microctonus hyperodae]|uniref:Uncharacterized protein n=1 Tax=Microctonus hyperodae TaxID=165561 RepID=A0AA39FG29_MICHY|nr:hypothetical protein PV327_002636 [Microctonus hyperodae]